MPDDRREPEPYDISQPFDAEKLMDGWTEVELPPVDPDSPEARHIAAMHAWLQGGMQGLAPEPPPGPFAGLHREDR